MFDLARFFVQLSLLQRRPQDLPDSLFLFQVLLVLNLVLNFPLGIAALGSPGNALAATLLELALSAALLFAGLQARGMANRWRQSYSALLGVGIVGAVVTLVYRGLTAALGVPGLSHMFDLALFMWLMLVMGHVIRHTFDIALPFGILIVFAYTMFLLGLVAQWFAPELAGQSQP